MVVRVCHPDGPDSCSEPAPRIGWQGTICTAEEWQCTAELSYLQQQESLKSDGSDGLQTLMIHAFFVSTSGATGNLDNDSAVTLVEALEA